jgi:hypothetical protein
VTKIAKWKLLKVLISPSLNSKKKGKGVKYELLVAEQRNCGDEKWGQEKKKALRTNKPDSVSPRK